jgi:exodeoxyribonuclease III
MKIITWNVNGIRSALNKGLREWVNQNSPDILCLQEIKARPEQIENDVRTFPGFVDYWNPAVRPGYSGVAVYTRVPPQSVEYGLGIEKFDQEGRVIKMKFDDFWLFNVYFPNGQRGQERVGFKLEFYESLLRICDELIANGQNVILTGDFNTAHREIDLANPKENVTTSGFMPEERVWIDYYLEHGFADVYRVLYPDRVQYTWWTYRFGARRRNIGWRIDYFLVTTNLMDRIIDTSISETVEGSDHCPVSLIL